MSEYVPEGWRGGRSCWRRSHASTHARRIPPLSFSSSSPSRAHFPLCRSRFQLNDSAAYFIGRADAVAASGYVPTMEDVLRARARTSGILAEEYKIEDVSSNRGEGGRGMRPRANALTPPTSRFPPLPIVLAGLLLHLRRRRPEERAPEVAARLRRRHGGHLCRCNLGVCVNVPPAAPLSGARPGLASLLPLLLLPPLSPSPHPRPYTHPLPPLQTTR